MKTLKIVTIFALAFILLGTASSCKRRKSLAELRREERQAIAQFIKDNDINVIHEFPADTVFAKNDYYLSPLGLYIHVIDNGDGIPPREGETVFFRFYEMNLRRDTTIRAMEPNQPGYIIYDGTAIAPAAFNEAASYMGHEGEAFLIVPSKIGSDRAKQNITPYYYHIRIQIQ